MGKSCHNDVFDAMLDEIATANMMIVCVGEPTDYADATTNAPTGEKLADVSMTAGDGNDYTVGDGDTNGRKVRMAEKATIPIDASGTAGHVVLVDTSLSKVLYVTTCTPQALTSGGTVTVPAWDIEIADPT